MYTQKDSEHINTLWRRFLILIILVVLACLGLLIWALWMRWMWFGYAVSAVSVIAIVFSWGIWGYRIRSYRAFLRDLMHGLERQEQGTIVSIEANPSIQHGLEFTVVNLLTQSDGKNARMLLFDSFKGSVPAQVGQTVSCKLFGMYIKEMDVL